MEKYRRPINRDELEKLLPDEKFIHVFEIPGDRDGIQWPRSKIFSMFETLGAEVGGEGYKQINHGILILEGEKIYAIQNRTEVKVEKQVPSSEV
jgi:hypothetical protein